MSARDDDLYGAELVDELERLNARNDRAELELIGLRRIQHDALRVGLERAGVDVGTFEPPPFPTPAERRARQAARWDRIPARTRKMALVERGVLSPYAGTPTRPQPNPNPASLIRDFGTIIEIR